MKHTSTYHSAERWVKNAARTAYSHITYDNALKAITIASAVPVIAGAAGAVQAGLAAGSFLHPARKGLWITCFFLMTLYLYYTKNYIFTSWFWMVVIVFFHFILCEHFQSAISPSALWFIFSSFSSLFFYFDSELTPTLVTTSVLILSLWYGKGNLLNLRRSSS